MPKALLFDNDGVLVDTEPLYFHASREILAELGVDLTEELFIKHFLMEGRGAWHLAVECGLPEEEVSRHRRRRNELYSSYLETEPILIEGVEEVLEELGKSYRMAVVTSSKPEHFEKIHNRFDLLRHFEFVLTREMYERSKPCPDPYLLAIAKLGLQPEECLVVEDSYRGLQAAKAAGIPCVIIPTRLTRGSDFSSAVHVLDALRALRGILD